MAEKKEYTITLRILNTEIFALVLSTTSDSTKWVGIGVLICLLLLAVVLTFGDTLIGFLQ